MKTFFENLGHYLTFNPYNLKQFDFRITFGFFDPEKIFNCSLEKVALFS